MSITLHYIDTVATDNLNILTSNNLNITKIIENAFGNSSTKTAVLIFLDSIQIQILNFHHKLFQIQNL